MQSREVHAQATNPVEVHRFCNPPPPDPIPPPPPPTHPPPPFDSPQPRDFRGTKSHACPHSRFEQTCSDVMADLPKTSCAGVSGILSNVPRKNPTSRDQSTINHVDLSQKLLVFERRVFGAFQAKPACRSIGIQPHFFFFAFKLERLGQHN